MRELITNFNNISAEESFNTIGGENLIIAIIIILSALGAAGVFYGIYRKGELIKTIVASIVMFALIFFSSTIGMFIIGDEQVKENRLREIIEVANKEGLSTDLIINDTTIIYDNVACKHGIYNIKERVQKNNNNEYVFIEK